MFGCRVSICMFSKPCLRVHKCSNIRRLEDYGVTSPLSHNLLDSDLYTTVLHLKTKQARLRLYAFCDGCILYKE